MKLHSTQIEVLAHTVVKKLAAAGAVKIDNPEEVMMHVARVVTADLQVEDRLNEEVREILANREGEMRSQGVQYHEMFKLVKHKLVRERKLIL